MVCGWRGYPGSGASFGPADSSADETDGAAQERPPLHESGLLQERRLGSGERIGDLHARATLVTRRGDQLVEQSARGFTSERGVVSFRGTLPHPAGSSQLID